LKPENRKLLCKAPKEAFTVSDILRCNLRVGTGAAIGQRLVALRRLGFVEVVGRLNDAAGHLVYQLTDKGKQAAIDYWRTDLQD